jgi:UDP-N-acetylmuramate--alanine ligase
MHQSFATFTDLLPPDGTFIVCTEDVGAAALIPRVVKAGRNIVGYGVQKENTMNTPLWVIGRDVRPNQRGGFDFVASSNLKSTGLNSVEVSLQVPGEHNVRNALAVLGIVDVLGLSREKAAKALAKFTGTGRRFELRGEVDDITVFDDYAHHPTEIKATLAGARARYAERRIWAVWQPHTYSRTHALYLEFSRAFKDADEVIVTEVYAAREPKQDFTSAEIVSGMPHHSARFVATLDGVTKYLLENLKPGDVLIVLSAGDADKICTDVLKGLKGKVDQHE